MKAIIEMKLPEDFVYEIRRRKTRKEEIIKALQFTLDAVLSEDLPEYYAKVIDIRDEDGA